MEDVLRRPAVRILFISLKSVSDSLRELLQTHDGDDRQEFRQFCATAVTVGREQIESAGSLDEAIQPVAGTSPHQWVIQTAAEIRAVERYLFWFTTPIYTFAAIPRAIYDRVSEATVSVDSRLALLESYLAVDPERRTPENCEAVAPRPPQVESAWEFLPGLALYRGHEIPISGNPWKVLKMAAVAKRGIVTEKDLFKGVWPGEPVEGETVRDAVRNVNDAIRKALGGQLELPKFPLDNCERGQGSTAWRLMLK
jgi:hypothetical protein